MPKQGKGRTYLERMFTLLTYEVHFVDGGQEKFAIPYPKLCAIPKNVLQSLKNGRWTARLGLVTSRTPVASAGPTRMGVTSARCVVEGSVSESSTSLG